MQPLRFLNDGLDKKDIEQNVKDRALFSGFMYSRYP